MSSIKLIKVNRLCSIRYNYYSKYVNCEALLSNRRSKRGSMLSKMIENKDRNKKWHLNFMEMAPRAKSVFEGVHKPNKRQSMLESLFVKNITDVLSTGEIAPEIFGFGIEITGVKISSCYKTLNVYWQVPPNNYEHHQEIAITLNAVSPRLRAELISRNVMGKVPYIYFIRDVTNYKIVQFENALRDADLGPENERSIIPDDAFTKDVLIFRQNKKVRTDEDEKEVKSVETCESPLLPTRPPNMKSDVFGLKHDVLMNKIIASRRTSKSSSKASSDVVSSEFFPTADLFDRIPGETLQPGIDRSKLLKQFQLERKMEKTRNKRIKITKEDFVTDEDETCLDDFSPDFPDYEEDLENSYR